MHDVCSYILDTLLVILYSKSIHPHLLPLVPVVIGPIGTNNYSYRFSVEKVYTCSIVWLHSLSS